MLTDVKNLLNHHTGELDLMVKKLEDTDAQFVECTQQIKDIGKKKCQAETT
jgi:hypothetical protein